MTIKQSKKLSLNRQEIEAIAIAHGFTIAGPDHPIYKEPPTVVLVSLSRHEVANEPQDAPPQAVQVKPIFFNVVESGTILNRSRSKNAQEEAMRYFEALPWDILEELGVEVIEGDHPGSTYYAARLRNSVDIAAANRAAKKLNQPFRFKTKRHS